MTAGGSLHMTGHTVKALKQGPEKRAAIGEVWVLPSPTDGSEPVSRHL